MTSSADEFRQAQETHELRMALANAERRASKREGNVEALVAAVYRAAREAALLMGSPPPTPRPAKVSAKGTPFAALLHTTDWQTGKRTSDFNSVELQRRLELMMVKASALTDDVQRARPVAGGHVMLGGDMVEGVTIFPGQVWEIETSLYEQLFTAVRLMRLVVDRALALWPKVDIWCEPGNHGRLGRKGEQPDNVDNMAYRIAAEAYANEPRATWHLSTSWHQIVEIGNYRALLVHGDEINSYGGNHPSYGIVRKVQQWQSGVVAPFTDAYMGHFHRPDTYTLASGGSIYLTGSPESGNEYAREFMAATGRPSQRLHFVDPQRGHVAAEHRLWLA